MSQVPGIDGDTTSDVVFCRTDDFPDHGLLRPRSRTAAMDHGNVACYNTRLLIVSITRKATCGQQYQI